VGVTLGYTGSRQFNNGEQALKWLAPDQNMQPTWPAESWRDKGFNRELTLDDLRACCASMPDKLAFL
tara:strand:+ start:4479 stop:4679 length:201 start_codon:yes stop_codon:yes gene_type:complete